MEQTTVAIDIKVNSKEAIKTLGDLEKETEKFNEELNKVQNQGGKGIDNINTAFEELNKTIESGDLSMRDYAKAVKQYQTIALKAGETSPIGQEAIKRAAALRDRLGDLSNAINATAHDGANMQAALQVGSTVTAGYGVMQGAITLVGEENEQLMQSMVKLQAATSVLTGIEQIRANLEKESFLMIKAKAAQTYLLATATGVYSTVVGTTTGALKILRLALISTGIGAIIVAIGLLIANFDKVTAAINWVVQSAKEMWYRFQEMGDGMKLLLSIMFPFIGAIWAITEALEAMGVVETAEERKAREAIEAKMKVATAAHNKRIAEFEKQKVALKAQAEAEKAATALAIKNIDREIELRQAAGEEVKELEAEKLNILIQSARQQYNIAKALMELQDQELFARREHMIELAKIQGKNTANLEAELTKEKRARSLLIQENLAAEKDALDQALHNLKVFNLKAANEKDKEKEKEKENANEIERIYDRRVDNIKTANKEIEESSANLYLILSQQAKEAADKQAKLDKEALDKKLDNIDQVENATSNGFDFLLNLNEAFGKDNEKAAKRDFQLNKAKNLSEATADGFKAVLSTFANTPTGLGGKIVASTAAGLFAASNIARIASSKFGGSSSGGNTVSLPSTSSGVGGADVGTVSNTTTTIGGSSQVYVLEQDISSTQNRVAVLENQATF